MNAGLITHSTETVATMAVTSAGIAATSENSATTRLCSRAAARAARRAARKRRSSRMISVSRKTVMSPSPPSRASTTPGVGMIGVNPAKVMKVANAKTSAPPTASGPNAPEMRWSSSRPAAGCSSVSPDGCESWVVTLGVPRPFAVAHSKTSCAFATLLQDYDKKAAKVTEIRALRVDRGRESSCAGCCD